MSLSLSSYPPGFGHQAAASMGVTSAQDYYSAAHYPVQMSEYPEYGFTERNYLHNWVLGGGSSGVHAGVAVSGQPEVPVSPHSYGTPSPVSSIHQSYPSYTDSDHGFKQWQHEYGVSSDIGLPHGLPAGEIPDPSQYEAYTNSFGERCYRRRTSANRKERRRTVSINNAFSNLRGSIPNVPSDTKLSKIKTLRLAISYIAYLNEVLEKGDSVLAQGGFKADISRKRERRPVVEEKKPDNCDSDDSTGSNGSSGSDGKGKGRTGWPQTVWASELKTASPK